MIYVNLMSGEEVHLEDPTSCSDYNRNIIKLLAKIVDERIQKI